MVVLDPAVLVQVLMKARRYAMLQLLAQDRCQGHRSVVGWVRIGALLEYGMYILSFPIPQYLSFI